MPKSTTNCACLCEVVVGWGTFLHCSLRAKKNVTTKLDNCYYAFCCKCVLNMKRQQTSQGNIALFSPPDMARDCCLDLRFFWRVVDTWQELLHLGNRKFMWREICSSTVVRKKYLPTYLPRKLPRRIHTYTVYPFLYVYSVCIYVCFLNIQYLFTQAQKSLYVLICIPYTHFCIFCKYIPQKTHYTYSYVYCKPIPVFVYIHTYIIRKLTILNIHTYIHTYIIRKLTILSIHTYIHCILMYVIVSQYACVHTYIHTFLHAFIRNYAHA